MSLLLNADQVIVGGAVAHPAAFRWARGHCRQRLLSIRAIVSSTTGGLHHGKGASECLHCVRSAEPA